MTQPQVLVGNAPVSYGAFEVTVGQDENVPSAEAVLDAVTGAGYRGIDLGPLGYLGTGTSLAEALAARNLLLTGGYVEIDISSPDTVSAGLTELERVCDEFDAVRPGVPVAFLPRPTVAIIAPGVAGTVDRDPELRDRVHRGVQDAVKSCAERGYDACLHNEVGTCLASQASLLALLDHTSAALCLDTGHLVAAGGDPVAILSEHPERVHHLHLKDARFPHGTPPYAEAMDLWESSVFCPLGEGDGRVDDVLTSARRAGFCGWVVVEQDVLPRDAAAYAQAARDQAANRQWLAERNW